ncbi:MAG: hypothetical protein FWD16_03100 [Clostridia bacterium]|nr:hypothetical protein [Clostridia bacterium]
MKNDLITRYIYAVTRHLPEKTRADVEKELDSLIADMLEQRCGAVLPTDHDIRVVLTELGDPENLAAKYSGDEQRAFISGTYLLLYKRILRLVLPIAIAGIAFASLLGMFQDPSNVPSWPSIIPSFLFVGVAGAIGGALQAFAVITIIFAIMEHKKVNLRQLNDGDMFSRLPLVPQKNAQIKPHEPIINMLWSVAAAVLFLCFPHIIGAWGADGHRIPAFDTAALRGFWLVIVLWAMLAIGKETFKLIEGRYTKRLAIATFVANILIMASTAYVFLSRNIMNTAFIGHVTDYVPIDSLVVVRTVFENFGLVFFGVVSFALLLETAVTAIKAWKYDR